MSDADIRSRTVAIIPAKAHSRRVPGKNMRAFHGKPLIAYAVEEAKRALLVDRVYVSTDSPEIRDLVLTLGAEAPFLRPPEQALPEVHSTVPVIDLITREHLDDRYTYCIKLLPTFPLRTARSIDGIVRMAWERERNVISVGATNLTLPHLRTLDDNGLIHGLLEKPVYNFQAQDAPNLFFISGFAQCAPIADMLREGTFQYGTPVGYPIEKLEIADIDTEEDFRFLESLYPSAMERLGNV